MISAAIVVAAALGADVLTVGSPAPAFSPEKFLSGTEFRALEPGKVYVVEFWATWCGPCLRAMPHLAKLQADNPDIVVVGIAGMERVRDAEGREKKVNDFLQSRGGSVGFPIAVDHDGSMAIAWMNAAKKTSIPCSFVVGKDGRIAYVGHPEAGLDDAVRRAKAAPAPAQPAAPGAPAAPAAPGAPAAPAAPRGTAP
jgi:thiol-disulfide isomerase/thioredoxin